LMGRAGPGEIWVLGEVADQTGARFTWGDLPETLVKGRQEPVRVRSLRDRVGGGVHQTGQGPAHVMIGRRRELAVLEDLWARARSGAGRLVVVQAEAGTGKTRLVQALTEPLSAAGVPVVTGEAALARQAAYAGWREVWTGLLGLGP